MRPSDGAYVLFEGVVRNHHEGKAVESIFYDAYRPMAEKEIAKIVDEVRGEYRRCGRRRRSPPRPAHRRRFVDRHRRPRRRIAPRPSRRAG